MQNNDQNTIETAMQSLSQRKSRRSLLRGAIVGAAGTTGLVAAGAAFLSHPSAHAASATPKTSASCTDSITTILSIAATAEQLAIAFYTNGINNASKLGISGQNLNYLTGAVVEEQIHRDLLVKAGGTPVTGIFSFPHADKTFTNLTTFIKTLDQLETAFESAYLAAIKEFADMGNSSLAQLAGQIVTVEAEHRALGRSIAMNIPTANNWAFTPVYVKSVGDAVNVLTAEGYLSPTSGNSYTYKRVDESLNKAVVQRTPYVTPCS